MVNRLSRTPISQNPCLHFGQGLGGQWSLAMCHTFHFRFVGGFTMSEIRPTSQRPEPPRVQQERPVKTEQKVKNDPPPKMEPQREVARQEVKSNDKPKGGNVDITV